MNTEAMTLDYWPNFEAIPDSFHKMNIELQLYKLKLENYLKKKWMELKDYLKTVPDEDSRQAIEDLFNEKNTFTERFDTFKEESPDFISSLAEAGQSFKNKMSKVFEKVNVKEIWLKMFDWLKYVATLPLRILEKMPTKVMIVTILLIAITWWAYFALEALKTWALLSASPVFDALKKFIDIDFGEFDEMVPAITKGLWEWAIWEWGVLLPWV